MAQLFHERSADVRNLLERASSSLRAAWTGSWAREHIELRDFIPVAPEHPAYPAFVAALIAVDYECRLRFGCPKILSEYLADWSDLAKSQEWVAEVTRIVARRDESPNTSQNDFQVITQPFVGRSGSSTEILATGYRLGCYEIRRVLGRGGMGTVYLAEDLELNRLVALKVPRIPHDRADTEVNSLLDEAKAVAQLDHPCIIPIYYAGWSSDGVPFIAMKYVQGRSLETAMKHENFSQQQSAELIARIAEAVHFAHTRGFVHRDLKPSNILLDDKDFPYVADFGLALHESQQHRHRNEISGTLAYMAPEQLCGRSHLLDGRTDVWALGVILYQLLTKRLPFQGRSIEELEEEILERDPKPLRQINDEVSPELERICLKCLEKDVKERYRSAAELAADLRRFLKPHQHRWLKILSLILLVLFVAATALTLSLFPEKRHEAFVSRTAQTAVPLDGSLDVWVWSRDDPKRRGVTIREPWVLPLRPGDQIRIDIRLNRAAYLYVFFIDSKGEAFPLYPWAPGDWSSSRGRESPVAYLSLPRELDQGWPVVEPFGTETILMLARDEPCPEEINFKMLLSGLSPLQTLRPDCAISFAQGQPVVHSSSVMRGFSLGEPGLIDDSLIRAQKIIEARFQAIFPLRRAVCFTSSPIESKSGL